MHSKILNIDLSDKLIVSDIDDCLIKSTESIVKNGFSVSEFYFDKYIYDLNKKNIFSSAELTTWGIELIDGLALGHLKPENVKLLTKAVERFEILFEIFGLSTIVEGQEIFDKVDILNKINDQCIYVDDKPSVSYYVDNEKVNCVLYKY